MWIVFPGLFVSRRISKKLAQWKGENRGSQEEHGCCVLRHTGDSCSAMDGWSLRNVSLLGSCLSPPPPSWGLMRRGQRHYLPSPSLL
ncbi:rCG28049 [Rattus norvegicus]|uniref:RCG28049 n=1 Tax=Rattus norvegicus TaxID=10116 RepID=A6IET0_RAT|nr:rCG28049 [Rattus norvegicus]